MKILSLFNYTLFILGLISGVFGFSFAYAQEEKSSLPFFFNTQERLPQPDLGTITHLRFVTTVDFPPFNFINSSGYLAGYHIDLMRAICTELKLETACAIEAAPFDELILHVEKGDADAIITGFAATARTREKFDFTATYFRFPARFMTLVGQDLPELSTEDLKDVAVGVIQNTAHEKLLKAYFPMALAVSFADEKALIAALQEKKVKAVFGDGMRFSFLLNSEKGKCCHFVGEPYMAPQFLGGGLRIAVPRGETELIDILNYALKSLEHKGKLKELYLRYFPIGFY